MNASRLQPVNGAKRGPSLWVGKGFSRRAPAPKARICRSSTARTQPAQFAPVIIRLQFGNNLTRCRKEESLLLNRFRRYDKVWLPVAQNLGSVHLTMEGAPWRKEPTELSTGIVDNENVKIDSAWVSKYRRA